MTDAAAITAHLRRILGAGVGIAVTDPTNPGGPLMPEEEPAIARAVESRRQEFTAGRVAARAALAQIGHPPAAIPSAPDRSPIWPAGIVGSITHCADLCIAITARQQTVQCLGIDIEPDTPLPPDMLSIICTAPERDWLAARPATKRAMLAKFLFCAKECAYKAIHPLTGKLITFQDMTVTPDADGTRFSARTEGVPPVTGHLVSLPHHILCLSMIPPVHEAGRALTRDQPSPGNGS